MKKHKKHIKSVIPTTDVCEIDAKDQSLGRVATAIVRLLQGKHKASFLTYLNKGSNVVVKNVSQIKYTGNKLENKTYYHYSGYPGGMKRKILKDVVAKDPTDALKRAVYNMLPKNRLRKDRMKKLSFV